MLVCGDKIQYLLLGMHVELRVDVLRVRAHRILRDEQAFSNIARRAALAQQLQHLHLARSQAALLPQRRAPRINAGEHGLLGHGQVEVGEDTPLGERALVEREHSGDGQHIRKNGEQQCSLPQHGEPQHAAEVQVHPVHYAVDPHVRGTDTQVREVEMPKYIRQTRMLRCLCFVGLGFPSLISLPFAARSPILAGHLSFENENVAEASPRPERKTGTARCGARLQDCCRAKVLGKHGLLFASLERNRDDLERVLGHEGLEQGLAVLR